MYLFGITKEKISKEMAEKYNKICIEEGGKGFLELNRLENEDPSTNNGKYYAWFEAPNYGSPFDSDLAQRVKARLSE